MLYVAYLSPAATEHGIMDSSSRVTLAEHITRELAE